MNHCDSKHSATAPYYREARVTIAWRQTACRMRHCCARRIDECSGRRKLVCTTTRQAERQRIVEAEASRLAALNAATPRYGQCNRQASHLFELLACNGGVKGQSPLRSLGGPRGPFSHVREWPPLPVPLHGAGNKDEAPSGCSPSAPCAEKERTSLSRSPLFLPIFCRAEAIIPLPASPSRQRQPSPVRRRNTARSARSASRTSRGTGSWSAGQWRSSSALPRGTRPR